jgi:hypothetical protein
MPRSVNSDDTPWWERDSYLCSCFIVVLLSSEDTLMFPGCREKEWHGLYSENQRWGICDDSLRYLLYNAHMGILCRTVRQGVGT